MINCRIDYIMFPPREGIKITVTPFVSGIGYISELTSHWMYQSTEHK